MSLLDTCKLRNNFQEEIKFKVERRMNFYHLRSVTMKTYNPRHIILPCFLKSLLHYTIDVVFWDSLKDC